MVWIVGYPLDSGLSQRVLNKKGFPYTPPDHESDQKESEDKESLSEVNQKANQMEFIKDSKMQ